MGYDTERFDDFICPVCKDVVQDPVYFPNDFGFCEFNFCRECITQAFNLFPLDSSSGNSIVPAQRYMKKAHDKLELKCKNFEYGCEKKCSILLIDMHENSCAFSKCDQCGSVPVDKIKLEKNKKSLEEQIKKLQKV